MGDQVVMIALLTNHGARRAESDTIADSGWEFLECSWTSRRSLRCPRPRLGTADKLYMYR